MVYLVFCCLTELAHLCLFCVLSFDEDGTLSFLCGLLLAEMARFGLLCFSLFTEIAEFGIFCVSCFDRDCQLWYILCFVV